MPNNIPTLLNLEQFTKFNFQKTEIDCTKKADGTAADDATKKACTDKKEKAYDNIQKLKKSDISDLLLLSMMGGQGNFTLMKVASSKPFLPVFQN